MAVYRKATIMIRLLNRVLGKRLDVRKLNIELTLDQTLTKKEYKLFCKEWSLYVDSMCKYKSSYIVVYMKQWLGYLRYSK